MLRLDRTKKTLTRLPTEALASAGISERYDLQDFIVRSPDAFFAELGEKILLIASEVQPSDDVADRIDLLGVDEEGNAVIVELKRGNDKLQLFQAISYAAMIADWELEDFENCLNDNEEAQTRLSEFLDEEGVSINRSQSIILVAEAFDYAVLIGAEWLSERYGVNIRCCQLSLATDPVSRGEYLVCTNIFPAPEIAKQAIQRGRKRATNASRTWANWQSAINAITNPALANFFRMAISEEWDSVLSRKCVFHRVDNERRWRIEPRIMSGHAYVVQIKRFTGDDSFWAQNLSTPGSVKVLANGNRLSFRLKTEADFAFFLKAIKQDLANVMWLPKQPGSDESDETDESDES
jgi:hypothetical protein